MSTWSICRYLDVGYAFVNTRGSCIPWLIKTFGQGSKRQARTKPSMPAVIISLVRQMTKVDHQANGWAIPAIPNTWKIVFWNHVEMERKAKPPTTLLASQSRKSGKSYVTDRSLSCGTWSPQPVLGVELDGHNLIRWGMVALNSRKNCSFYLCFASATPILVGYILCAD